MFQQLKNTATVIQYQNNRKLFFLCNYFFWCLLFSFFFLRATTLCVCVSIVRTVRMQFHKLLFALCFSIAAHTATALQSPSPCFVHFSLCIVSSCAWSSATSVWQPFLLLLFRILADFGGISYSIFHQRLSRCCCTQHMISYFPDTIPIALDSDSVLLLFVGLCFFPCITFHLSVRTTFNICVLLSSIKIKQIWIDSIRSAHATNQLTSIGLCVITSHSHQFKIN